MIARRYTQNSSAHSLEKSRRKGLYVASLRPRVRGGKHIYVREIGRIKSFCFRLRVTVTVAMSSRGDEMVRVAH
jgi:hypothetical protein